jgi:hypothetical protein
MKYRQDKTYMLLNETKRAEKRIKELRERKKKIKDEKIQNYIDKEIKKIQSDFNKKFNLKI